MIDPNKTMIRVSIPTTSIQNHWDTWAYPQRVHPDHLKIVVVSTSRQFWKIHPMMCIAFGCWCPIGTSCGGCYCLLVIATVTDRQPATEFRKRHFSLDDQGAGEFPLVAWRFECSCCQVNWQSVGALDCWMWVWKVGKFLRLASSRCRVHPIWCLVPTPNSQHDRRCLECLSQSPIHRNINKCECVCGGFAGASTCFRYQISGYDNVRGCASAIAICRAFMC